VTRGAVGDPTWRRARERAGRRAEALAVLYLRLKGYRIEGRRVRTPAGEIDIVARRGGLLIFVEVKARVRHAAALEAVTPRQRRRIERGAEWFAARTRSPAAGMRFDVVAVRPWRLPSHLADAWRPAR
jgi:putative endonuclease